MDQTPASLLEQLRDPARRDAWPRFVHLFTPLLVRWCERIGVPPSDRADLVQDVFLSLVRTLPEFAYDPSRSFRRWLYAVAANRWRDVSRRRAPAPMAADDPRWGAAGGPDPAEAVGEAEHRAVLAARAARLVRAEFPPAAWQAFWATAADGRPAAEVAADLGVTPNAVYLARSRVLARLRRELAGVLD